MILKYNITSRDDVGDLEKNNLLDDFDKEFPFLHWIVLFIYEHIWALVVITVMVPLIFALGTWFCSICSKTIE